MNLKIYQAYYDQSHIPVLDSAFIPFDNTANERPDLREYPLLKKLFQTNRHTDAHWGLVSWKWKEKTCLEPSVFKAWIEDNPGYDVYHIDPYLEIPATCTNLWTQDNYTDFANLLFPKIGINIRCENLIYRAEDFATCNYIIGNSHFWTEWFLYIENILVICSQDDDLYRMLYKEGREYENIKEGKIEKKWIPNFTFIVERLVSLFFIQNRNITVKKFPVEHECYDEICNYGKEKHQHLLEIYNLRKKGSL